MVVAHGGSNFDMVFIVRVSVCVIVPQKLMQTSQELAERGENYTITSDGLKVMELKWGSIRFLCSYRFMQAPLSKLPRMFGFPHEEKGV